MGSPLLFLIKCLVPISRLIIFCPTCIVFLQTKVPGQYFDDIINYTLALVSSKPFCMDILTLHMLWAALLLLSQSNGLKTLLPTLISLLKEDY